MAERLPGEMDPPFGGNQSLGQIPRQLSSSAGKPAREQQKLAAEGLLEGMAMCRPDLEGRRYPLELLGERSAVEERLRAEMTQFNIAFEQLGKIGGVSLVAPSAVIEQVAEGGSEQKFSGRIMRQMPQQRHADGMALQGSVTAEQSIVVREQQ